MVDRTYMTGVHKIKKPLNLHTNTGTSRTNQQGYLGSHLFWLDEVGIANMILLRSLEKKYHVRYDSHVNGGAFIVTTPGEDVTFGRCPETGFPFLDLDNHSNDSCTYYE